VADFDRVQGVLLCPRAEVHATIDLAEKDDCLASLISDDATSKAHIVPPSVANKVIRRCRNKPIGWTLTWGPPVTVRNEHDRHSDYGPAQLTLFVAAAIVLLVFAWTFVT
jgi:hypothetical protein